MQLENRVALVTGASRGIGKAIALELAEAGADIVFTNRTPELAKPVQEEIEAKGRRCLSFQADVGDAAQVEQMVADTLAEFEKIDVLVNNAAITRDTLLMRMKPEDWSEVMRINLDGLFHTARAVVKPMMKQRHGRIINITSVVGFTGNAGQINYSSAKAAVLGFTKSLAKELGSRNITCNAVAPGFIDTDMTRALNEAQQKAILDQIPLGRMGDPREIAKVVRFLASDDAAYISGDTLHVNGGMY